MSEVDNRLHIFVASGRDAARAFARRMGFDVRFLATKVAPGKWRFLDSAMECFVDLTFDGEEIRGVRMVWLDMEKHRGFTPQDAMDRWSAFGTDVDEGRRLTTTLLTMKEVE